KHFQRGGTGQATLSSLFPDEHLPAREEKGKAFRKRKPRRTTGWRSESERFMRLDATARDSASRPLRLARPSLSEKHQPENPRPLDNPHTRCSACSSVHCAESARNGL